MSSFLRRAVRSPFFILPLVALVGLAGWLVVTSDDESTSTESAVPVQQIVAATRDPLAETVTAEGTVEAAETDDLSFASAGTVTAVNVAAGDAVTAGDVLATIDSAELEAAVAEAEASIADAEATLAELESGDATGAQIEAQESSLEVARDQLDSAEEALEGAQLVATIDGTVASVGIAVGEQLSTGGQGGTSSTGSESGSGRSAGDLGGGDSASPFPGGGTETSTEDASTEAHIQVVSTGRYAVELGFDEADASNLAVGQEARVSLSTGSSSGFPGGGFPGGGAFPGGGIPGGGAFPGGGLPGSDSGATEDDGGSDDASTEPTVPDLSASEEETPVNGFVKEVGTVADASSGVASYPVTVVFSDDGGELIPGATASVEITYSETEPVVQVPSQAVTTTDGTSTVTVDLDGEAGGETEERTVATGRSSGGMTEITDGIAPGDQVVIGFGGRAGAGASVPEGFTLPEGIAPPGDGEGP